MPIYGCLRRVHRWRTGVTQRAWFGAGERFPRVWAVLQSQRHLLSAYGTGHVPVRTVSAGYKPWRMAVYRGQQLHISFDSLIHDAQLFHATEHLLFAIPPNSTVLTYTT